MVQVEEVDEIALLIENSGINGSEAEHLRDTFMQLQMQRDQSREPKPHNRVSQSNHHL